jgi:hypothetical protein
MLELLEYDAAAVSEARCWHIVTGPGQHSLPLDLGCPDLEAHYYCGLPAYWRLRDMSPPSLASSMDVAVDPAWGTSSPIPFVEAEVALLRRVLSSSSVRRPDTPSRRTRRSPPAGFFGRGSMLIQCSQPGRNVR